MLKIFPEQADDLLDVDALPPTDKTELNYRTRPLTAEQIDYLYRDTLYLPPLVERYRGLAAMRNGGDE